jgi:hypothetical protein
MDEQQDRRNGGDDDTLQNAEEQDAHQGYSRHRKLQLAYAPQVSELLDLDQTNNRHQHNRSENRFSTNEPHKPAPTVQVERWLSIY